MKHAIIIASLLGSASAFSIQYTDVAKTAATAAAAGAIAFGVCVSPAAAAHTFAGNPDEGEIIFNANCAACHSGGQTIIMHEKTLEKAALDTYLAGGRTEAAVRSQVSDGKNAMPAFGGRLSDEDIENVASFVIKSSEEGWE